MKLSDFEKLLGALSRLRFPVEKMTFIDLKIEVCKMAKYF